MSDPQILNVQADSGDTSLGWATLGDRRWRCTVGAGGVREDKVEGDAATPAGSFPLRRIYFRNDRLVLPKVRLPARSINEHDGWRDDGLYDLVVVVGYNDDPPEGEWGSAIFLHVARDDYSPTQGCMAFKREDLLELVTLIGPETKINVHSIPASETAPKTSDDDMKQLEDFDEQDW